MTVETILKLSHLSKTFGTHRALSGVDLEVAKGEVVCVIGPSGCGKSTLLRCINYLSEPDDGLVELEGKYFGRSPAVGRGFRRHSQREINRERPRIGFVFQQFNLWPHLTVLENVARAPRRIRGRPKNESDRKARELLTRFGLADKLSAYPATLSGGQQQRVAVARALAMDPALLLCDEPTSALDPETINDVLSMFQSLAVGGMTMVCVTHELGFARAFADRVVFIDHGQIVEIGPPSELLSQPRSPRLREFLGRLAPRTARAVEAP